MGQTPKPEGPPEAGSATDLDGFLLDQAKRGANGAIEAGLAGWWGRADDNQKLAWAGLAGAAALGPLGQGLLAATGKLFATPVIPNSDQITAVFWLLLIAAPLTAWCFVIAAFAGKASGATIAIVAGVAAYFGGLMLAGGGVPAQLGDLYCFAALTPSGVEYEHACRAFDALGFLDKARPYIGSASGSAKIAEWAFVYTADARGSAMAIAGAIAGLSAGYLARRAAD